MGRITVFVTDGNVACTRTLAAFQARKLPVTIINVSYYPEKRSDMSVLLSGTLHQSTPQVFFNTRYVGDADATLALLEEWSAACTIGTSEDTSIVSSQGSEKNSRNESSIQPSRRSSSRTALSSSRHSKQSSKKLNTTSSTNTYNSVYERYMAEIGNFHDPSDAKLSIPVNTKPILDEPPTSRDPTCEFCIAIPGDQSTVVEMTQMFIDLVKQEDHTIGPTTYRKSFMGKKVIDILTGAFEIRERDAVKLASYLLSIGLFHSLDSTGTSFDIEALYRLQCHHTPTILNSFRSWMEDVDNKKPLRLIHHLIMKFNGIEIKAIDARGILHPSKAKKMNEFIELEEGLCELQGIDISRMNDRMKMAFGINVYNLMIRYAAIKVGVIPASKKDVTTLRATFLNSMKFNVGGHCYTFAEWEHGILRGNVKSAGSIAVPFSKVDPRLQYVVSISDPRVLLCILTNHGIGSCPEFGKYTAEHFDKEMALTAECYCEKDCHLMVDVKKRELHLSKIFCSSRNGFTKDKSFLPHMISKYARGSKKKQLDAMIEDGKAIKIVEIPLDYRSSYYSETHTFDFDHLKMDDTKGGGLLASLSPRKSSSMRVVS